MFYQVRSYGRRSLKSQPKANASRRSISTQRRLSSKTVMWSAMRRHSKSITRRLCRDCPFRTPDMDGKWTYQKSWLSKLVWWFYMTHRGVYKFFVTPPSPPPPSPSLWPRETQLLRSSLEDYSLLGLSFESLSLCCISQESLSLCGLSLESFGLAISSSYICSMSRWV